MPFLVTNFVALTCVVGLLSAADDQAEKPTPFELHVTGMSCHNCADAVEDALAALDGLEVVSVDPKGNLAIVKIVSGKVTREMMVAAVKATDEYALEPTVEYSKLEYENDGSFSLDGKPFTGTATDVHKKSGKRSKNYQFKGGQLHGLVREWYDNGQMAAKKFYQEGKRHGKTEYWDEAGELTATKIYKDDEHVDEDGNKIEE